MMIGYDYLDDESVPVTPYDAYIECENEDCDVMLSLNYVQMMGVMCEECDEELHGDFPDAKMIAQMDSKIG